MNSPRITPASIASPEAVAAQLAKFERMSERLCEMLDILTEHETLEQDSVEVRTPDGSWLEIKHALRNIVDDKAILA